MDPFTPEGSEGRQPAGRVGGTRLGNEYSARKKKKDHGGVKNKDN